MADDPRSDPADDEAPSPTPAEVIDENRLRPEFVTEIADALDAKDDERIQTLVEQLHPADLADLIELLPAPQRPALAKALGDAFDADVISELNDWVRDEVIEALPTEALADVVTQLETDDAVAILEELDNEDQAAVLQAMPAEDRVVLEQALTFPEESAGRLMQRDLVAVPTYWTVGQVIDHLRESRSELMDFWEIFVVDPNHKPVGCIRLSWLLRCPRAIAVEDVMQREQTLIPVDMDREELAQKFQKYHLISAAVVDGQGRLIGMITVDDVVHVIQEEAQEDLLKLTGAGDGDINEPVIQTVRARVPWLMINALTALAASTVISFFGASIEQLVALAVLMPIVASMGGNAGIQTMTVAVRALATNELTASNATRIVWRESRVALLNGLILSCLVGAAAGLWFGCWQLGAVMGAALTINILTAGLMGVLVPVTLERLGKDPAVGSSIFVTMATDMMGFFAFLGLATAVGLGGICAPCCGS
jgi:magnesium transporter